jgi:osmotically-inducible protein OsmY
MVIDGKVTLTGTVKSEALKRQIEKLVREVRGVRDIDNQILVMG